MATYHYIIIEGLFNYMCVCVEMGTRANNYKLQEFFHMKKVISQASKGLAWFHQLYRSHLHNLRHAGLTCQKKNFISFVRLYIHLVLQFLYLVNFSSIIMIISTIIFQTKIY